MKIDKQIAQNFNKKIAQVFLYLIDDCNADCIQCLYKPERTFQLNRKEIPFKEACSLMKAFYELGAVKITFMGGEPTLYGELPSLVKEAKKIGYSYIRIDTNGLFDSSFLENNNIRLLDEITFSVDGYNEFINDKIRGKDYFNKCVGNIKSAINKNYNVQITTCIHKELINKTNDDDIIGLIKMIKFAKALNIKSINMHDLLKGGIPRDVWTGTINTSVAEYLEAFKIVFEYFKNEKKISIRMPQCVISKDEFNNNKSYYGYCSVKEFDRLLAFPNGMLRICSLMIGSPYCVGFYDKKGIYWNNAPTNEINSHDFSNFTPCTNQNKGKHFEDYYPLCVSFKPKQSEYVWINKLQWENRTVKALN